MTEGSLEDSIYLHSVLESRTTRLRKIASFVMRGPSGPPSIRGWPQGHAVLPTQGEDRRRLIAKMCIDIQRCSLAVDGCSSMRLKPLIYREKMRLRKRGACSWRRGLHDEAPFQIDVTKSTQPQPRPSLDTAEYHTQYQPLGAAHVSLLGRGRAVVTWLGGSETENGRDKPTCHPVALCKISGSGNHFNLDDERGPSRRAWSMDCEETLIHTASSALMVMLGL